MEQNLCSLCRIYSSAVNKEHADDLKASHGMGWQRKGSGRPYNSRSGHGVLIGKKVRRSCVMEHELVIVNGLR